MTRPDVHARTLIMAAEKLLPGWRRTVPAVGADLGAASLLAALV